MIVKAVTQNKIPSSWHYGLHYTATVFFVLNHQIEEFIYFLGIGVLIYLHTNVDLKHKKSLSDFLCITFLLFAIGSILDLLFYNLFTKMKWWAHLPFSNYHYFISIYLKLLPMSLELFFFKTPYGIRISEE